LALRGPTLAIRRFQTGTLQFEDMLRMGMLATEMGDFLAAAVRGRMNMLLSGGSGAGKTTLLNNLSRFIAESERVITIEDTAELQLQQPDVVSLEVRPANLEGRGEVTQRDLLKHAFRLRADRIIIGEVRGGEVFELLQAMHTGHAGSMSTIHADDVREALERLELMAALSGADLPVDVVRRYIASAVQILIHVARLSSGERKITRISELVAFRDGDYAIEDIFVLRQNAMGPTGSGSGSFYATGYEPRCLRRLAAAGLSVRPEVFTPHELGTSGQRPELPQLDRGVAFRS
jgi:pilus assembly protein CpaF